MLDSKKKVLVISQWPKIKNAEYQLIECIKEVSLDIKVVDSFGVDVSTGKNINNDNLHEEFEFAIALHFDTPKLLNIKTYYWVSNPIEYLYLKPEYGYITVDNIRSFDDYLFNGSDVLKRQVENLLGEDFTDNGYYFYPSTALSKICSSENVDTKGQDEKIPKVFYCGINWERIMDKDSRAQGMLSVLERKGLIDIFGPSVSNGVKVWDGFSSYQGEIPFDSSALACTMQQYQAVLCVSSPAHIRSKTSSSRVFEAFAAGVPVISDKNEHVEKLFGSLAYYFSGNTDQEKSEEIERCLQKIQDNKEDARERVSQAQDLIRNKYAFDVCLGNVLNRKNSKGNHRLSVSFERCSYQIVLYHHDPTGKIKLENVLFENAHYCLSALGQVSDACLPSVLTVISTNVESSLLDRAKDLQVKVDVIHPDHLGLPSWNQEKLGAKIVSMIDCVCADAVSFINSFEFPHYDYFEKHRAYHNSDKVVFISGGFYDFSPFTVFNQASESYHWSNSSFQNNQLGRMIFPRSLLTLNLSNKLHFFDLTLPVVLIFLSQISGYGHHRSRFVTLKMKKNVLEYYTHFFMNIKAKGFWPKHYLLITNFDHEINAGYDLFLSTPQAHKWEQMRTGVGLSEYSLPRGLTESQLQTLRYLTKLLLPAMTFCLKLKRKLGIIFSHVRKT